MKLLQIDLDDVNNHEEIEAIKDKAGGLGFYEAYFEAGPQFILQLSIVIRIGYVCKLEQTIGVHGVQQWRVGGGWVSCQLPGGLVSGSGQ